MPNPNAFPGDDERLPERVLSREEILAEVTRRCESVGVVRVRTDDAGGTGIYWLEAQGPEKDLGDYTLYEYQRKGAFPGSAAAVTVLQAVYYSGGQPTGGDTLAEYNETTGQWTDVV